MSEKENVHENEEIETVEQANPNFGETITQEDALKILISAVRVGQSKGAYTLEDAELISKAIKMFTPKN